MSISILLITTVQPIQAQAPEPTWQDKVNSMSYREMVEYIAPQFNQSPKLINKISMCESGHKILPHDNYRGVNITGIHDTTFNGWLPQYEKEVNGTLDIKSQFDQLKMMSWAFSKGYANQWTTYRAYKNGGTIVLRNSYTKELFTSQCV